MRLIAVGDMHGQIAKLEFLVARIKPTETDRLVFLGDYIDRGKDSKSVVDFLIGFCELHPQTVALRGNHEQMFLDALASAGHSPGWKRLADLDPSYAWDIADWGYNGDIRTFLHNGGWETLRSYGFTGEASNKPSDLNLLPWEIFPKEHIDFFKKTRLWHRQDGFLFVHAGAPPGRLDQEPRYLLWERYGPPGRDGETQVVGHTPTQDRLPFFGPGRINLDTGAGYGGPITACDVLTGEVWQSNS